MVGRFMVYPVGKNKDKSKSGKNCYTFLSGLKSKDDTANKLLLDRCESFSWWTDQDFNFSFMKPVYATIDIQGDFKNVLEVTFE